jgi:hypothetical protein
MGFISAAVVSGLYYGSAALVSAGAAYQGYQLLTPTSQRALDNTFNNAVSYAQIYDETKKTVFARAYEVAKSGLQSICETDLRNAITDPSKVNEICQSILAPRFSFLSMISGIVAKVFGTAPQGLPSASLSTLNQDIPQECSDTFNRCWKQLGSDSGLAESTCKNLFDSCMSSIGSAWSSLDAQAKVNAIANQLIGMCLNHDVSGALCNQADRDFTTVVHNVHVAGNFQDNYMNIKTMLTAIVAISIVAATAGITYYAVKNSNPPQNPVVAVSPPATRAISQDKAVEVTPPVERAPRQPIIVPGNVAPTPAPAPRPTRPALRVVIAPPRQSWLSNVANWFSSCFRSFFGIFFSS